MIVGYFAEYDYLTTVIKKIFLQEESDEKFYARFLNEKRTDKKKIKKNCCLDLFTDQTWSIDKEDLKKYQEVRKSENFKCFDSFADGDVDKSDI